MFEKYTQVTVDNPTIYQMTVQNRLIKANTLGQVFSVPNPGDFVKAISLMGHETVNVTINGVLPFISLSPIAEDNQVEESEATAVVISGKTNVEDDQEVSVVIKGSDGSDVATLTAIVASGKWETDPIDMSAYSQTFYVVTADVANADGEEAKTAQDTFSVVFEGETDPVEPEIEPTIAIDVVATDDSIDSTEAASVVISGTSTDIEDGQNASIVITDATPAEVYNGVAAVTSNAWASDAIDMSSYVNGDYTVTVNASTADGVAAPEATKVITVALDAARSVKTLNISDTVVSKLLDAGIDTVEQLEQQTPAQLLAIDGIGESTVKSIEKALFEQKEGN
ncbi:TPA: helix-hairpin-helix domain-containing protein [Vibrio parahaemolyticus]